MTFWKTIRCLFGAHNWLGYRAPPVYRCSWCGKQKRRDEGNTQYSQKETT